MMIGSADGSDVPCSLSFISFMAMENSNLSIFPSLFMSARVLTERGGQTKTQITGRKWTRLVENLYRFAHARQRECVLVSVTHQISASTEAGSPDWRKNFLACSPAQGNTKRRK